MPADPIQDILDAIARLDVGDSYQQRRRLAEALAAIAGTNPDEVRSASLASPRSALSNLYLFMYLLQNKLLGMTPNRFHPERPVSLVGYVLKRQTERMAPAVATFLQGFRTAQKIKRKSDASQTAAITEYKKTHTWDETDDHFNVERGTCYRRVLREKKRRKRP